MPNRVNPRFTKGTRMKMWSELWKEDLHTPKVLQDQREYVEIPPPVDHCLHPLAFGPMTQKENYWDMSVALHNQALKNEMDEILRDKEERANDWLKYLFVTSSEEDDVATEWQPKTSRR